MTSDHTLSLVLPAYNEEDNLEWVVREALAALPRHFRACEVIVVDDGSRDATGAIADRLAASYPQVRAIHHARRRGYGAALRAGFAAARGERIMFMDADRQYDVREVAKLAPCVERCAVVAGYRLQRRDPWPRVVADAAAGYLARLLFGLRARDLACGFTIIRADLLRALDLRSPGALINTEILALARQQAASIAKVGVCHYARPAGRQTSSAPRAALRAPADLARLWWHLRVAPHALSHHPHPR